MIVPITSDKPHCFGVCCARHAECARYVEVDGSETDPHAIGRCGEGDELPLFVEVERSEA